MTWLQGVSQWGTVAYDLTRLICGEAPDGQGVTAAAGDRWVRDQSRTVTDAVTAANSVTVTSASAAFTAGDVASYFTAPGVPAGTTITAVTNATTATLSASATEAGASVPAQIHTDTIRTHPSTDIDPGQMPNRAGYFAATGDNYVTTAMTTSAQTLAGGYATVMRVTVPAAAPPTGVTRWLVRATVSARNTVAGNYSTAQVNVYAIDLDTGTAVSGANQINLAPNAAGVLTSFPGTGMLVSVSDPSGFLTLGATFMRAFSSTYLGGVDWWPMLSRAAGNPTFGTAPPGTQGTDWEISQGATAYSGNSLNYLTDRGSVLYGLGIKTGAALTGARYTTTFPIARGKCRIWASTSAAGLALDVGGSRKDEAGAVMRCPQGFRINTWARLFTTMTGVPSSAGVQYRLSVTGDGIVLVATADPGFTGKQASAYYCAFAPVDEYDVIPMVFNWFSADYTGDNTGAAFWSGTQYLYWPLRHRQDGTAATVRDWQTGWMRSEPYYCTGSAANAGGTSPTDITNLVASASLRGSFDGPPALNAPGMPTSIQSTVHSVTMARQVKPAPDGRWWLYPVNLAEGDWSSASATDEWRTMRGTLDRFCFLPEDVWISGDELTDTATGATYFLVKPDYQGTGGRARAPSGALWGGVAIRET
jgi:hypothetical protein